MAVFILGVIPPRAVFGLSLLYVQSHSVAKFRTSAMLAKKRFTPTLEKAEQGRVVERCDELINAPV